MVETPGPNCSLICPECRYEIALVHKGQWLECQCPGCGASVAGDALITIVEQERPATDEDLNRWIRSYAEGRDRNKSDSE